MAQISFDLLPSIATNLRDPHNPGAGTDPAKECLNTIDAGVPSSHVLSLPAITNVTSFLVEWTGQDGTNGSGVESYDVYVSDNSGPWTPWLSRTTNTSAIFTGQPGHTNAFYSIARDNVGNVETKPGVAEASIVILHLPLLVEGLEATSSGFTAQFNQTLNESLLNLYDTETNGFGPADFTVVGSTSGPVAGSLIYDPQTKMVTFIKTGGVLAPDTYIVTLRSGTNGFQSAGGDWLDGDTNGVPGGDYVRTMPIAATGARVLSLPDFARGPGQPVDVPAIDSGIPVTISDGTNVSAVYFLVEYEPAMLEVTGVSPGSSLPEGWIFAYDADTPGLVAVLTGGPNPQGVG